MLYGIMSDIEIYQSLFFINFNSFIYYNYTKVSFLSFIFYIVVPPVLHDFVRMIFTAFLAAFFIDNCVPI